LDQPTVDSALTSTPQPDPIETGRPKRNRQPPKYLEDFLCHAAPLEASSLDPRPITSSGTAHPIKHFLSYDNLSRAHRAFVASLDTDTEPKTYSEAVKSASWREAMQQEIHALETNGTWTLEKLPEGKRPIGCKWVFKIKRHADGSIERYKARLVAKGYTQVEGLDFNETFAPVAKLVSIRCLLTIALAKKWQLHQMDVNNAFLHGDLDEEVYMRLPPGFSSHSSNKVCRLRKSLYGLKQASRNWFSKFSTALITYGFQQSPADHSLFTYHDGTDNLVVLVYVDDLILASSNPQKCQRFKAYLNKCFRIKDLGSLKYFLGIEVAHSPSGIFLCQRKYTLDILTECGMLGARPSPFPMEQQHKLTDDSGKPRTDPGKPIANPGQYRRLVGRLVYLTITRPELCYSVHILSQFLQDPREKHWDAVMRVLRYLKGNPGQGTYLQCPSDLQLRAYCDSDYADCPTTRQSITGYFITLGGCPVSWKTKKQTTVSRSSAEAEYRAMASTTCELLWLRGLITSLGIPHTQSMELYCDNKAALYIAANPVFHERTKHIEIDCHFIRQHIQSKAIATAHIPTTEQPADIFTKALGRDQFHFLLRKLGVLDIHAPT
jgi:hypothetical protein